MNEEEVNNGEEINKEIYSNLKYKIAPDEQDQAFEASLLSLRKDYFGERNFSHIDLKADVAGRLQQRSKVLPFKTYLKWATGIAAVLLIGLFIWAPWNVDLYEQYAISRSLSVAERGDSGADLLSGAAEKYNRQDYASAKVLFAKVYEAKPEDAMIAYYYAITLVETGDGDKGREIFEALYQGESVFKYDAAFYMALSYIKLDQKEDALKWLDKIPAGTTHDQAARELKQKLR